MRKTFLKARFERFTRRFDRTGGNVLSKESFYRDLVVGALSSLGVAAPPLYPVAGAANWTLLYGLLRLTTEMECRNILELGAGQSTLLLDALAEPLGLQITTLETDPAWADRIASRTRGRMVLSDVASGPSNAPSPRYADLSKLTGPYDLILVDGPAGSRRRSRSAALPILEDYLAEEFVVIFDDAERRGEQDTIKEFATSKNGRRADWYYLRGEADQMYFFTRAFSPVKYM